jgi:hypothetical protein
MDSLRTAAVLVQQNSLLRLYKHYVIDSLLIINRHEFKKLSRQKGWKFLVMVGGYYVVRDTILYVVIPVFLARGLLK